MKAQMYFDNVLNIYARSGLGCKYGVVPKNCVGIIDASYYGNEKNDGGIGICLENKGDEPYSVKVGDRIKKGDVLCIIEAMKLMNEVIAEELCN